MSERPRASLLRNHGGGPAKVDFLELFFDLVYVFAVTQVAHYLLEHLGWLGLLRTAMLFAAVWWAWMYTTWAANWADPRRLAVRVMMVLVMLASLLMAIALPHAFGERGLMFAACYVAIQVGRTVWMAIVFRREAHRGAKSMTHIAVWFALSAVPWLLGGVEADPARRMAWWGVALVIDYAGPFALFRLPLAGSVDIADWEISGSHMAERCALFIIIVLGEGILVTGATYADGPQGAAYLGAFLVAFFSSVMLWWLYFDVGAERGAAQIEAMDEAGRMGRNAYTYLHVPIVAGIVLAAVADELLLAHPMERAGVGFLALMAGGFGLFLVGVGAFKKYSADLRNFPFSHEVGLALLAVTALGAWWLDASQLAAAGALLALLAFIATWEWVSFHGGWLDRLHLRETAYGRRMMARVAERRARRRDS